MGANVRVVGGRSAWAALALVAAAAYWPLQAHALFSDDEARKAIIDLRQRFEAYKSSSEATLRELQQRTASQRALIELSMEIEQLRTELARLRGENEQLARQLADLQREQQTVQQGVEERLREFEPATVTLDGESFKALPAEKRDYEAALEVLRSADFPRAETAFEAFLRRYPDSGFRPWVLYWLGNAQYANRKYQEAVGSHRQLINNHAQHPRVPEAMLAVANSLLELKDTKAARQTLNDLIKAHPSSEAAAVARERLAKLR
jgi:tol-pal system protein YbgF